MYLSVTNLSKNSIYYCEYVISIYFDVFFMNFVINQF